MSNPAERGRMVEEEAHDAWPADDEGVQVARGWHDALRKSHQDLLDAYDALDTAARCLLSETNGPHLWLAVGAIEDTLSANDGITEDPEGFELVGWCASVGGHPMLYHCKGDVPRGANDPTPLYVSA